MCIEGYPNYFNWVVLAEDLALGGVFLGNSLVLYLLAGSYIVEFDVSAYPDLYPIFLVFVPNPGLKA